MKTPMSRACGLSAILMMVVPATAQSMQTFEWKVSDGGNGHWYGVYRVPGDSQPPEAHFLAAQAVGGHTATISSAGENAIVFSVSAGTGALIGVRKEAGNNRGAWITGELWVYTRWHAGEGGNSWERYALMPDIWGGDWLDTDTTPRLTSVVEWEADCNGDGIVDHGQIRSGQLIDLNANGVPDVCETSISGVSPPSVPAQGGVAVTIRGNFPSNPTVLVGGVPASNVVRESITKITLTSPPLLPGMTSVTVDDFTLADAIYVRPECGSDLDQDGSVDTADVAIILLDFGPCNAFTEAAEAAKSTLLLPEKNLAEGSPQQR